MADPTSNYDMMVSSGISDKKAYDEYLNSHPWMRVDQSNQTTQKVSPPTTPAASTSLGGLGGSIKIPFGQMPAVRKANPVNLTNPFVRGPVGFKPFESPQIPPTPEAVTQPQNSPVTMPGSLNENPVAQAMRSSVQHPNRPKIYMPDFTRGRNQRGHNWLDAFSVANIR